MNRKSTKWTWAKLFEKIEQELNYTVDKDIRLFFDA
jgi:hypothetical protein